MKEDQLTQAKQRFIEGAGFVSSSIVGLLNRVCGQIFGALYLSPKPLSLDEIVEEIGVSKGNVSVNIRILENYKLVKKIWVKGSRKDYYEAVDILPKNIIKGFVEKIRRSIRDSLSTINDCSDLLDPTSINSKNKSEVEALKESLDFNIKYESLLFLPLAHILARGLQFAQLGEGFVQCYAESIDKLIDNIAETRPHIMVSVPRIFEKVYAKVIQGVESGSDTKKKIFYWAVEVGKERADRLNSKSSLSLVLKAKWALAYKLVFSKLHEKLGGRSEYFILGGAPLSPDIATFFAAAGFYILEGYGLTETTAGITCNTKEHWKIGSVGKPLPGARFKIAEDGEILVKGPMVFKEYFKRPDATKEAIDKDGWFHTGDIGVFDEEGFLKITDRKKDIIVTAAGKNIAPQNIENLIKTDPFISQVMVHGDKRKYLSALVTLNEDEAIRFAKENQIPYSSFSELAQNKKLFHMIKARIEGVNKRLAKYETIKKFAILDQDFSVETGELTPTLKVKRKYTSEKYKQILDSFYSE